LVEQVDFCLQSTDVLDRVRLIVARPPDLVPFAAACLALLILACGEEAQPPVSAAGVAPREAVEEASSPGAEGRRSVLLVTLDTTRADRIGAYGHAKAMTPTLDRLANEGVLFEAAVAPTPITLPSHASILTGLYPAAHGVHDNGLFVLTAEETLISEIFQDHGWRTGAFLGATVLDSRYGLDQGFEVYRSDMGVSARRFVAFSRLAENVVLDAIRWLTTLTPDDPFFAWVHFYDPHYVYTAPEPWRSRLEDPYDAEIAYTDSQLDRLLRFLERQRLTDDLVVAVTADHGESLGEHGETTHGVFLYQAVLHVPLILWGQPLRAVAGTRVARRVSLVDLPGTLLELAGVERGAMPALSELSTLAFDDEPEATSEESGIPIESYFGYHRNRWHALRGLISGNRKLILGKTTELYALDLDPTEEHNLALEEVEEVAELRLRLEQVTEVTSLAHAHHTRAPDPEEHRQLESLGYLVGCMGDDPFDPNLPDPVARMGDEKLALEAEKLINEGQALMHTRAKQTARQEQERIRQRRLKLQAAKKLLSEILANNPGDLWAIARLGFVENELGNVAAAIELMERAVRESPRNELVHSALAMAYERAGRLEDAAREMQVAISLSPVYRWYYEWLVHYYTEKGEFGRACGWLEALSQALELGTPLQREAERRLEALEGKMLAKGQQRVTPDLDPASDIR
jgi:arylsulfatase A-like enzyme